MSFRVLELFAGVGGCSAALAGRAEVVAAIDINRSALAWYAANFAHPTFVRTIESLPIKQIAEFKADLWWLSPPCQPYTRRGLGRDLDDPRSAGLKAVIGWLQQLRPRSLAMENVPEFAGSRSHDFLRETLDRLGYFVEESLLCPTELGIPNRRRRFYLVASLQPPPTGSVSPTPWRPLKTYVEPAFDPALIVPADMVTRYRHAMDVVDADDPLAFCATFTSAYGRSPVRSGSYLRLPDGQLRMFSPTEILRLLGFPPSYSIPLGTTLRQAWSMLGNSLSVPVVAAVLESVGLRLTN